MFCVYRVFIQGQSSNDTMKLSVNETTGFWLWLCPYSTSFDFKICLRARKVSGALGVSRNGARVLLCNLVNNSVTRPSLPASWLMLISKIEGAVSVYSPRKLTVIKKLLQNGKTMTASGQRIKVAAKIRHSIWLKRFYTENDANYPKHHQLYTSR